MIERRIHMRREDDFKYSDCPKYMKHELTEEQIIVIASKAVEIARTSFYTDVGKSIVSKALWGIGLFATAVVVYFNDLNLFHR